MGLIKTSSSYWRVIVLAVIISALCYYFKSSKIQQHEDINNKAISVVTAKATKDDVPVYISALGTVTSEFTITVTPQVSGKLIKVLFKDGQKVQAGDLLAEIDKRPYQAALTQVEGQLLKDQALLENAKLDLQRYKSLWQQNAISKQILDTQLALVNQYEGAVKLDKGQEENAKINLTYCQIVSPIDGQVGMRLVDQGNIVQSTTATNIAVINNFNPIMVMFSVPAANLQQILSKFQVNSHLEVLAYDQQLDKLLVAGKLLAIDNQIDPTTGTIKLKASFQNESQILFSNQFVNIKLLLETLNNVVVVPLASVQHSPKGNFVYKLDLNNKVKVVPIEIGVSYSNLVVIKSGLVEGDVVVTEGADKLTDDMVVKTSNSHEHL